ncbi:MAG TPA: hypothetical protein VFX30_04470 [bacterium]|nr:hypothetical protein [bacterium]
MGVGIYKGFFALPPLAAGCLSQLPELHDLRGPAGGHLQGSSFLLGKGKEQELAEIGAGLPGYRSGARRPVPARGLYAADGSDSDESAIDAVLKKFEESSSPILRFNIDFIAEGKDDDPTRMTLADLERMRSLLDEAIHPLEWAVLAVILKKAVLKVVEPAIKEECVRLLGRVETMLKRGSDAFQQALSDMNVEDLWGAIDGTKKICSGMERLLAVQPYLDHLLNRVTKRGGLLLLKEICANEDLAVRYHLYVSYYKTRPALVRRWWQGGDRERLCEVLESDRYEEKPVAMMLIQYAATSGIKEARRILEAYAGASDRLVAHLARNHLLELGSDGRKSD